MYYFFNTIYLHVLNVCYSLSQKDLYLLSHFEVRLNRHPIANYSSNFPKISLKNTTAIVNNQKYLSGTLGAIPFQRPAKVQKTLSSPEIHLL